MTETAKKPVDHPFSPKALERAARDGDSEEIVRRSDGYRYYRHKELRLVYALPYPTERKLSDYYDGFVFQRPDESAFNSMKQQIASATTKIVEEFKHSFGARTGSIFDFGGGLGFYSNGFADHFDQVTMYDVDPVACDYARNAFQDRFEIVLGKAGHVIQIDKLYDVVFASHVIEHYVNLPQFFEALVRLTAPGGLLVVATPNNSTWEYLARPYLLTHYLKHATGSRNWQALAALPRFVRNPWLCCDPPRHIYGFTAESLASLAEQSGLEVVSTFTEYAWTSVYSRVNDQSPSPGLNKLKRVIRIALNAYARASLPLLRAIDRRKTRGGNLVMIARKET